MRCLFGDSCRPIEGSSAFRVVNLWVALLSRRQQNILVDIANLFILPLRGDSYEFLLLTESIQVGRIDAPVIDFAIARILIVDLRSC